MDPYVGEIRLFGFGFAPMGWAPCNGQLLPVSQNQMLFSLIGTVYGGDGQTTFGLPDFEGRGPLHIGPDNPLGTMAGGGEAQAGSGVAAAPTLTVGFCIAIQGVYPQRQ
jgi:microcystin-dependent protein